MRNLSVVERQTYRDDGVAVLRDAVTPDWVERMAAVVEAQLAAPSRWANDGNPGAETDRHFSDRYLWRENAEIGAFIRESGVARLAAEAMESESARFYFDHILVKEPGTAQPTPWHQDIPYWPFRGRQICSLWLALTPCDIGSSTLEFVRGSHRDGRWYMAEAFGGTEDANKAWIDRGEGEPVPDIEADRSAFDIVAYDMQPGDVLIFSAWILHGAPGNASPDRRRAALSTRWLGDDAIWDPRSGTDPTVTADDVAVPAGAPARDDRVFPCLWNAS